MPELPDLEVISLNLDKKFKSKKLSRIHIHKEKKLNASISEFKQSLENQILKEITRNGKELLFTFKNGAKLGIHLMLKGEVHLINEIDVKGKVFELIFDDDTGFSITDFMAQAKPILNPEKSVVPDALDATFNLEYLKSVIATRKKANIKKILKDQEIVRGIGNAYVDEILWEAQISPMSIASLIPEEGLNKIIKNTKSVLLNAVAEIKKINPKLISGEIRDFLKIHSAEKEFSPTKHKIQMIVLDSKKTYYTDEQKLYK